MAVNTIQQASERFRKRLREPDLSDRNALSYEKQLASSYTKAWDTIKRKWDLLAQDVNTNQKRTTAGALYRMDRYKQLMRIIEERLGDLTVEAREAAAAGGFRSIDAAIQEMLTQHLPAGYGPTSSDWEVRGNRARAEAITAFTSEFSPLSDLFQKYGLAAAVQARTVITSGVIAGLGTDVIARGLREALGTSLWHSNLIARTEVHRAYREAQRIFVEGNHTEFKGYIWRAALDNRTCIICWERHGTFYPVWVDKEGTPHAPPFESHPGCRCALVPRARSLADIVGDKSIEDVRPKDTGREKFAKLPTADQKRILGPKRFDEYNTGRAKLSDMIVMRPSGRWGRTPRLKTLAELNYEPPIKVAKAAKVAPPPKPAPGKPGGMAPDEMTAKALRYQQLKKDETRFTSDIGTLQYELGSRTNPGTGQFQPTGGIGRFTETDADGKYKKTWFLAESDPATYMAALRAEIGHRSELLFVKIRPEIRMLESVVDAFPVRYRVAGTRPAVGNKEKAMWDDSVRMIEAWEEILVPYGYTGHTRWGGQVSIDKKMTFAGVFGWGDRAYIGLDFDVALGRNATKSGWRWTYSSGRAAAYSPSGYYKVLLHEAGHSMNPLLPGEFTGKYGWEEGIVEKATQIFEQDMWRIAKIAPKVRGPLEPGYKTYAKYTDVWDRVYSEYVTGVRNINTRDAARARVRDKPFTPQPYLTEREWYGRLLSIPSSAREGFVRLKLMEAGMSRQNIEDTIGRMNVFFAVKPQ